MSTEIPESLREALGDLSSKAERRGFDRGYEQGSRMGEAYAGNEVFLLPAHSSLGNWMLESCRHGDGPDYYVTNSGGRTSDGASHIGIWQTEAEATALAESSGFVVSDKCPHAPGARRQFVRPPYPW